MTDEQLQQAIEDVASYIQLEVVAGFMDLDEIVPYALEIVEDDYDIDELRPHAERILDEAVAEHRRAQATWPAVTDCDRFDAAFARLEAAGVVCRHNFSCCGTCAAGEIWGEIDAERSQGREIIGCAHYNVQDTESAVDGYGLCLSYGSVREGEEPALEIGRMIVSAMEAEGLTVTWDGSWSQRIHVAMVWKRRRPE